MSVDFPIFAISSSNDSGYSSIFTANGFDGPLSIYGHNTDNIIHSDPLLQSPFTEQHVGGYQHRHLPINEGSDNKSNRIERMSIEVAGGSIYISNPRNTGISTSTPSHDVNIPYSQVGRNEWIKRPVNIRNIPYTTASSFIGNYSNTKEFYQTSNRAANNPAFVLRGGYSVLYPRTNIVSSSTEFTLPDRSLPNGQYDQSVIIERFSAPGGSEVMSEGFLDMPSGQYSVYNSLPFRNLGVRNTLTTYLNTPMAISGGYESGSSTTASFHKVNQNPRRIIVYRDSTIPTYDISSEKDNGYINHSIPRSDSQYAWITASIDTTSDSNTLFFLNVVSMSVSNERTCSFDGVNSFYGFPSWRQTRNYERNSVIYLRNNNIFASSIGSATACIDPNDTSVSQQNLRNYVFTIEDSKTVTPITIKYKPVIVTVDSKERLRA